MWRYRFSESTEVPAEHIWTVISNISRWAEIDANIEYVEAPDRPRAGDEFYLKPRKGPRLRFVISEFEAPTRYADLCAMPLAEMKTIHTLSVGEVTAEIEISGPLSWFWGQMVGKKHASGLPALTRRMIEAAGKAHQS